MRRGGGSVLGTGLSIIEHLGEIRGRFIGKCRDQLFREELALAVAGPALLREIAYILRRGDPDLAAERSLLLVPSFPPDGIRGLAQELGLLRQAMWEVLHERGCAASFEERLRLDGLLDQALADAAARWAKLHELMPRQINRLCPPRLPGRRPPALPPGERRR